MSKVEEGEKSNIYGFQTIEYDDSNKNIRLVLVD